MLGVVPGPAVPAVRDARRPDGLRRLRHPAPHRQGRARKRRRGRRRRTSRRKAEARASIKEQLKSFEIELCLCKELNAALSSRATRSPRASPRCAASSPGNTASSCRRSASPTTSRRRPKTYQIRIHGTAVATQELRVQRVSRHRRRRPRPNLPGDEVREPAFGMRAIAIPEAFVNEAQARRASSRSTRSRCC